MALSIAAMNALNFLQQEPLSNWFDYFVHPKRLDNLLETPDSEEQISQLLVEFIDQAQLADTDLNANVTRPADDEDDQNYQILKCAKLWLCAFACAASLHWDIKTLQKYANAIQLGALFARLVRQTLAKELFFQSLLDAKSCQQNNQQEPDNEGENAVVNDGSQQQIMATVLAEITGETFDFEQIGEAGRFALWLYCRWVLSVDIASRFPEPQPRTTVSNPMGQTDPNLVQAESLKNAIANITSLTTNSALCLHQLAQLFENDGLKIPLKGCFRVETRLTKIDNSNFGGENETKIPVENLVPEPDFHLETAILSSATVLAKTYFDKMCYHFASGDFEQTAKDLLCARKYALRKTGEKTPYAQVDTEELEGYCRAFELKPPNDDFLPDTADTKQLISKLSADNKTRRHSLTSRCLLEKGAADPLLREAVTRQNIVRCYSDFMVVSNKWHYLHTATPSQLTSVAKALIHQLDNNSEKTKVAIYDALRFLSATVVNFSTSLITSISHSKVDCDVKRFSFAQEPYFRTKSIKSKDMDCAGADDEEYWQFLTTFDFNKIKLFVAKNPKQFPAAARFLIPINLGEKVLKRLNASAHRDYIATLLTKLNQQDQFGDFSGWQDNVNFCVAELGPLSNDQAIQMTFTLDAVRIELDLWHQKLHQTTDMVSFGQTTDQLMDKVEGLMQAVSVSRMQLPKEGDLTLLMMTFLLNTCNLKLSTKTENITSPYCDLAKLFAFYMVTEDEAGRQRVARGLWDVLLMTTETLVDDQQATTTTTISSSSAVMTTGDRSQTQNRNGLKRKTDGSRVYRERIKPKAIAGRRQLLAFVTKLKEQTSISLLLSLLGQQYNCATSGLNTVFVQHADYWPSNYDGSRINIDYLMELIWTTIGNGLLINPNNAFCLRSKADYLLVADRHMEAMQSYMETLFSCSDNFSRPFPDNVIDDTMWRNMMLCCGKMNCHSEQALFCQFLTARDEGAYLQAIKALEFPFTRDAADTLLCQYIFDCNLAEYAADVFAKTGQTNKLEMVLKAISAQEMNIHNAPSIHNAEINRRRLNFLRSLCSKYLNLC